MVREGVQLQGARQHKAGGICREQGHMDVLVKGRCCSVLHTAGNGHKYFLHVKDHKLINLRHKLRTR